jgi:hypothetical protein
MDRYQFWYAPGHGSPAVREPPQRGGANRRSALARLAGWRREQDRAPACHNAERMGIEALYRRPSPRLAPRFILSAARCSDHATEPGLGDGYYRHPDEARLRLLGRWPRLVRRRVLAWRVSITVEMAFCAETLEEALAKHDKRKVFNTDQGSSWPSRSQTC